MYSRFKRILSLVLVAALLAGFYVPGAQATSTGFTWKESDRVVSIEKSSPVSETKTEPRYQDTDPVRVSIVLEDKPTIQAGFRTRNIAGNAEALAYGKSLRSKQDALAQTISTQVLGGSKLDVAWNLTLAANLISATVPYGKIDAIAQVAGVKAVIIENQYEPCVVEQGEAAQPQMYASLDMTGSDLVWAMGFTGAGSRIAVIDTGTDTTHQSLNNGAFKYALEQNAAAKGMSYSNYVASLDLLDTQEIAGVLSNLNIYEKIGGVTASQLYLSEKLPFAANYIDGDLNVGHMRDNMSEHGSHVAGIATANRYIPQGSGYVDALETVQVAGAAPDAQLLTMKVFGVNGGAYDSDYMAAIEDAIYLNCDSVNLSLGSGNPGMSYDYYYSSLIDYFAQTDTVVVASAGNSFSWAEPAWYGYPYSDDVVFNTVGSPGSYSNFFTVASVESDLGNDLEYQLMSTFSSWGVPGNLSLKPEITAPGGNIYSIYGSTSQGGGPNSYEWMSGTSMAAPAITGITALVAQYLRESGLADQENISPRHLAQSLLMSTAEPLLEEAAEGNYYSLLKQGAGLVRVDRATTADSYILVNGQSDGKVKAELGDDPNRTGVYEFSFTINNLTNKDTVYTLRADTFCQDVFTYDGSALLDRWTTSLPASASFTVNGIPVTQGTDLSAHDLNGDGSINAKDADYLLEYLVGNENALHGEGDVSGDGEVNTYDAHMLLALLNSTSGVTVPANGSVTVKVRLALTAAGKQKLEDNYANGTYVEAFVYAESENDTVHSIPVLAFYGNWTDPNMFDHGNVGQLSSQNPGKIPYLYYVNEIYGNALTVSYGDGYEYYFGANPYVPDEEYLPERIAFNNETSTLVRQCFALIRNASELQIEISNADTGEVYFRRSNGITTSAFYYVNYGQWLDTIQNAFLEWNGTDASGTPLQEGTRVNVSLIAAPEYYRNSDGTHNMDALGEGAYLTTSFTIDNTYPEATDMEQDGSTLTVKGQDNQYVAAVLLTNTSGKVYAAASPNQTQANVPVTVNLDLSNAAGSDFLVVICDYAGNETSYEITLDGLPEEEEPEPITSTTLQAFLWDANADMWITEFQTDDLRNYTPLHNQPLSVAMDAATIGQDGVIYAYDADEASLYRVNSSNYRPSFIGYTSADYMDMAPAPHMPGNTLVAVYGIDVLLVDADSGDYYLYYEFFDENIIGVTYVGTNSDVDGYIDWYFFVGQSGTVYLYGLQEANGTYYYIRDDELAPNGVYANLRYNAQTYYWSSAYYDGRYLYVSAFQYNQENVAFMMLDTQDPYRTCTQMGTFPYYVYPVVGLMDMDADHGSRPLALPTNVTATAKTQAVVNTAPIAPMDTAHAFTKTGETGTTPNGSLNSFIPQSSSEYEESTDTVTLKLTGVDTAPNGLMTVTYDASALTLAGISGSTEAFAYRQEDGKITVAFASASPLAQDTTIATLTFQVTKAGEHTITVRHQEAGDGASTKEETLTVSAGCNHSYDAVVTPPTCTEKGFTTYTCIHCGDSYVDDYVDALDHSFTNYVSNGDATCTEDGTKTAHCDHGCGATDTIVDEGSATGHHYEDGRCVDCGEEEPSHDPFILGDADGNGVVNPLDALLILKYYTGTITEDELNVAACEVDGNGVVNPLDALWVLKYYTGVITKFPIEE